MNDLLWLTPQEERWFYFILTIVQFGVVCVIFYVGKIQFQRIFKKDKASVLLDTLYSKGNVLRKDVPMNNLRTMPVRDKTAEHIMSTYDKLEAAVMESMTPEGQIEALNDACDAVADARRRERAAWRKCKLYQVEAQVFGTLLALVVAGILLWVMVKG